MPPSSAHISQLPAALKLPPPSASLCPLPLLDPSVPITQVLPLPLVPSRTIWSLHYSSAPSIISIELKVCYVYVVLLIELLETNYIVLL